MHSVPQAPLLALCRRVHLVSQISVLLRRHSFRAIGAGQMCAALFRAGRLRLLRLSPRRCQLVHWMRRLLTRTGRLLGR